MKKTTRMLICLVFGLASAMAAVGESAREPVPVQKALVAASAAPVVSAERAWDFGAYQKAMSETGRELGSINQKEFQAAQARKSRMLDVIRAFLVRYLGSADESVMKAFAEVPREFFMYNYQTGKNMGASAYEVPYKEWAIGYGSTLSDYLVQAYMTQTLKPKPTDVSLEIGTGSGFQSSILSRLVKDAYTIEIITALGKKSDKVFPPLGYDNVHTRIGDGFYGWPEVKEGFDIIIVTAAAPFVPPLLLQQLKNNGRMIIPIGQPWRTQFLYYFWKDDQGKVHSKKEIPVLFIPMTGQIDKEKP